MRVVWVTLWFLDYRIPVFKELSMIEGIDFFLIYNKEVNSDLINSKVRSALGDRAIALTGEKKLGTNEVSGFANSSYRIPYQPGLLKKIKELRPDVMVSDGFFQWTYAPLIIRAIKSVPHVMCYERTKHTERNAQLVRKLYRKIALKWIDVICCSGKLCSEYVKSLGFESSKITVGHMVADVGTFMQRTIKHDIKPSRSIREKLGITGTIYLYVGRIIELKGIIQLLQAWYDFTQGLNENPHLILVGGGEQEDTIKRIISERQIDSVTLVGRVPYDNIIEFYRSADIFILPTLEDNWSLSVSEAMACGLPIITSIYNGCFPELVQDSNGWVMDPLDHEDFVQTLQKSYKARSSFRKMGLASLEIIEAYTPKTAADVICRACNLAISTIK